MRYQESFELLKWTREPR